MLQLSLRIMAKNGESIAEEGSAVDRISNLPRSVIDHILERVPTREAARTSILSRNWRYIWHEHPSLVFNKQFTKELLRNRSTVEFETHFANIVNKILLLHLGPILKFVIDISGLSSARYSDVDTWMLFLSRKGVKELILDNAPAQPYKIPYCLFSFCDLTYLNLSNCVLKAPNTFQGLSKLHKFFLQNITFEKSISISTPALVYLKLENCRGICNFEVSTSVLEWLTLYDNDDAKLRYSMDCPNMKYAYIALSNEVEHYRDSGRISLSDLLGRWLRLERLLLDGFSLKYCVAGTVPEKLPTMLNCLIRLVHFRINFDLDQIAWVVCLLKSSPVLQEFELWSSGNVSNDVKVQTYLEEASHLGQNIEQLRIVKMKYFKGSIAELLFVKLLLGCSPSLDTVFVEENKTLDLSERLRISKELMEFSRLSPKAKILFQPDVI